MVRNPSARPIRRRYANVEYPLVVLRFEDGHEIQIKKGEGKVFDAFAGETIKVLVTWDPSSGERELVATRRAEEFEAGERAPGGRGAEGGSGEAKK
jgi:hypothetical protein